MILGQVAAALGVHEKTADNAIRTLGLRRPLDEQTVRVLGLALRAKYRYGVPLKRAFPAVREAMIRSGLRKKDGMLREVFTYLAEVDRGIRSAMRYYRPLPRGPGWRDPYHPEVPARDRRHPAVRRAIQWGLDLSLNYAALAQTTEQRVEAWVAGVQEADLMQGGRGTMNPVTMCAELARAGVRFVVIGGAAGTLHGSARITQDLDICYDTAPDSVVRLAPVLNAWRARLHVRKEPRTRLPVVIDRRTFHDAPALSLTTAHGRIDLLPAVAGIGDYEACRAKSELVRMGTVEVSVLALDALVASKRAAGRPRDREHLIELEAIRALKRPRAKPKPRGRRRR